MNPTVTVIIATFNRAALLPDAIGSVLDQTFSDFELLVIDNGSSDNTRSVVDGYGDERIVYIVNEKPSGSCAAPRNIGAGKARGRYIAFLDDDDIWYPKKLEICTVELERHPEAALVCHAQNVVSNGRTLRKNICGPWTNDMHKRLLYEGNCLGPGSVVIRKEALVEAGGFDARREYLGCDDYDLWIRLAAKGKVFHFIDDALAEFRITGLNYSVVDPYHPARVAEMVKGNIAIYEEKDRVSGRARGRLGPLYFQAARTLHRSGRLKDALLYYSKALNCGYNGIERIFKEILDHKVFFKRKRV